MANSGKRRSKFLFWAGLIILALIILGAISDWIVEGLWLDNLGYIQVFWTIKLTQFFLFVGAFVVAMLYVLPNMYFLSKHLPAINLNLGQTPFGQVNLAQFTKKQIRIFLYSVGTAFSFIFSLAFFTHWDSYFRFHWNEVLGKVDPIFGHDIGFYMFRLPFINTVQDSLITLVFFVTIILLVVYLASGAAGFKKSSSGSDFRASKSVTRHLSLNGGLWLLLLAWGYFLDRYNLLYDKNGVVYGAGYTDVHVFLPVFWVMTIGCLLLAILAFFQSYRKQVGWLLKGGLALAAIGIIGEVFLPPAIQNFSVEPNELELETPYLKNNINQTRQAYKLNAFNKRKYEAGDSLSFGNIEDNTATLKNIRLWDPRLIIKTYQQLQEIRLYYQFLNVSLDRYHTDEGYKQMMISLRELSSDLPRKARTWINQHLQYTHGYGLVMSPVAEVKKEGDPRMVIKDLPPTSELNMKVKQPAVYYGQTNPDYKLVNTDVKELDYPKGDTNVYTNYAGSGGVSIDSFFEQLLFAWQFGDINLLLTDYIRDGSKIQFWKNIQQRVKKVAPFLRFEDDPYPVLSNGKLYWIQDAYTTSSDYPYSEPYNGTYNYIRNSVKVVVDAYDGSVNFYVADKDDPVLDVYRDVFPGMFKPLEAMPDQLEQHIRYPEKLFKVQLKLYNAYHMTTPQVFYNNEDLWTRPNEKYGGRKVKMDPYYLLTKLPGEDELQYLLISPLTPNNKDNMISWMAAKSDMPDYGDVEVFNLPKERLFLGPAQIEAKIDQDTEISRQLSLWDQRGSSVIRGNLMIIPIDNAFLYVEPVFLIAQDVDIPQLQRVIATTGDQVVMEPTLDEAIKSLFGQKPSERIMEQPQGAAPDTLQRTVPTIQQNNQFEKFRTLFKDMQQAMKNGNWETYGQKMEALKELMNEQ